MIIFVFFMFFLFSFFLAGAHRCGGFRVIISEMNMCPKLLSNIMRCMTHVHKRKGYFTGRIKDEGKKLGMHMCPKLLSNIMRGMTHVLYREDLPLCCVRC
jgi:hypothetical protein